MRPLVLLVVAALVAPAAPAAVKIVVRPDGTKVFTNTGSAAARAVPSLGRPVAAQSVGPLVDSHADRFDIDPRLVHAVIRAESGYNPRAVSAKGAMGLMQLMPETARLLGVEDPFDPADNIAGGTLYLRQMMDRFRGSLELALAGYNAGPERVRQYGGVPPFAETRRYVERVLRDYRGEADYSLAGSGTVRIGRPVYLSRDRSGRVLMTTVAGD